MRSTLLFGLVLVACKSTDAEPKPDAPKMADVKPVMSATPLVVASAAPTASALPPSALIRETKKVTIDGVEETWTLRWKSAPKDDCIEDGWYTAPCLGFAYGETGKLELVRERANAPVETLSLDSLFDSNASTLQHWPTDKNDPMTKPDIVAVKKRPAVTIMNLGDFDHDGRATELMLQTNAQAYGHRMMALVGVSKKDPKLHIFTNAQKEPLLVDHATSWEKLRDAKVSPATAVEVSCGDHGSDTEDSVVMSYGPDGISLKRVSKKCP